MGICPGNRRRVPWNGRTVATLGETSLFVNARWGDRLTEGGVNAAGIVRILIADDHALFRGGLRLQLADLGSDVEIVEASDFTSMIEVANSLRPDIIVADLAMPGLPWRKALAELRAKDAGVRIVVLSANDSPPNVREAIRLGANGFISKSELPVTMIAALRLVLCGGVYVPPQFVADSALGDAPSPGDGCLTHRQMDVVRLLAEGLSNKQIAYRLHLTEGTVKLHVAAIMKSLGASNRTQAVAAAQRAGLLPQETRR
jgi:DNA-binding NarL/FixJ family response regulator